MRDGGVEGELGYFWRKHWVPVLAAANLQALNRKLLEDCGGDENRIVSGQTECMGIQLLTEKEHPLPLPTALRAGRNSYPDRESGNEVLAVVERFIGVNWGASMTGRFNEL